MNKFTLTLVKHPIGLVHNSSIKAKNESQAKETEGIFTTMGNLMYLLIFILKSLEILHRTSMWPPTKLAKNGTMAIYGDKICCCSIKNSQSQNQKVMVNSGIISSLYNNFAL